MQLGVKTWTSALGQAFFGFVLLFILFFIFLFVCFMFKNHISVQRSLVS